VSRVTLVEGDELNTLDLVEPADAAYAARALARSVESTLRKRPLRVLSAEDFVLFKLLSTREIDLLDAASVVRGLGSDLERDLVERELGELTRSLASQPSAERWARVLDLAR